MTLKWMSVVVAAVSVTLCVTANVVIGIVSGGQLPLLVNLVALTSAGTAVVLAVVADLYGRIDSRVTTLTEFLVARLNEIDAQAGDRNSGFVEGYLRSHSQEVTVLPFGPRGPGSR